MTLCLHLHGNQYSSFGLLKYLSITVCYTSWQPRDQISFKEDIFKYHIKLFTWEYMKSLCQNCSFYLVIGTYFVAQKDWISLMRHIWQIMDKQVIHNSLNTGNHFYLFTLAQAQINRKGILWKQSKTCAKLKIQNH